MLMQASAGRGGPTRAQPRSAAPLLAGYWKAPNLCVELFAGRANEDELFLTYTKAWDCAQVVHGVATRGAHQHRRVVEYLA